MLYCVIHKKVALGPHRDLNPGPLPPKGRIIPLDHEDISLKVWCSCVILSGNVCTLYTNGMKMKSTCNKIASQQQSKIRGYHLSPIYEIHINNFITTFKNAGEDSIVERQSFLLVEQCFLID